MSVKYWNWQKLYKIKILRGTELIFLETLNFYGIVQTTKKKDFLVNVKFFTRLKYFVLHPKSLHGKRVTFGQHFKETW